MLLHWYYNCYNISVQPRTYQVVGYFQIVTQVHRQHTISTLRQPSYYVKQPSTRLLQLYAPNLPYGLFYKLYLPYPMCVISAWFLPVTINWGPLRIKVYCHKDCSILCLIFDNNGRMSSHGPSGLLPPIGDLYEYNQILIRLVWSIESLVSHKYYDIILDHIHIKQLSSPPPSIQSLIIFI